MLDGVRVGLADHVGSLLELLAAEPDPELLLLDLKMPGANGFSALAHVRTSYPTLPVVVISARDDGDTVRRALGHGAAGFIPKSADNATLSRALHSVLRGEPGHPTASWMRACLRPNANSPSPWAA